MDCDAEVILDSEFIENLARKARKQRIPVYGSMALTHRCNLRCKHCYLDHQAGAHKQAVLSELDTKTVLKIIDEITEAGCFELLLTGGDPLIRKDFLEIYQHAKKNGLILKVYTNGTLISDAVLEVFKTFPPQQIEITLYGATADTYESVTGVSGSYQKCLQGIEQLLAIKTPLALKTMVLTLNQHEFFAMEQMAENLGVKFRYNCVVFPCLNGDKFPLAFRIKPEQVIAIDFANEKRKNEWIKQYKTYRNNSISDKLYNCGAGRTSFHVDPYGNLMPCITAVCYKYDLLRGNFADCWNNFFPQILEKQAPSEFICTRCTNKFLCAYCPVNFYLENNSELERSEYLCKIGRLREEKLKSYNEK